MKEGQAAIDMSSLRCIALSLGVGADVPTCAAVWYWSEQGMSKKKGCWDR
jgi:hypothetical protein